ncbi:MAG: glycosyltransferase [Planctomycetes bacterium]|nr:glycosyltransferase [Planctomycetota bacterium]
MKICVVSGTPRERCETFIRAHIERLPGSPIYVSACPPRFEGKLIYGESIFRRAMLKLRHELGLMSGHTIGLAKFLRRKRVDVVLGEYGIYSCICLDACKLAGIPLVPHFHGHDATRKSVLEEYGERYRSLFKYAPLIVAVSEPMRDALIALGAPSEKIRVNVCGVDTSLFVKSKPAESARHFISVGRFVDKKAPHLTILAFEKVLDAFPDARLTMAGDGYLLDSCRTFIRARGLEDKITLPGKVTHKEVAELMGKARAFVQHSIVAPDGDSEGTPVAILEACACGLPVVSTRHAGIPGVIDNGVNGYLVDECDVDGMAEAIKKLCADPESAGKMGEQGIEKVASSFTMEKSIAGLTAILEDAAGVK